MSFIKSFKKVSVCLIAILMVACSGNGSKKEGAIARGSAEVQVEMSSALDLDELLKESNKYAGKEVTVEAVCTHICQHGGRKIFLMGSDDTQTIRVESGMDKAFSADCVNNIVEVTGVLNEQRVTEGALQKWEEQLQATAAESATHAGCDSEKKARGETADSAEERIKDFRARIAKRKVEEGKDYLSFYFIEASSYEIKS